jgi:hypothetical protein
MSYLQVPRLHFFGTYRASPSTINNRRANWDPSVPAAPLWNPNGAHELQILRGNEFTLPLGANVKPCSIVSVCGADGRYTTNDSAVGQLVISTNNPSTAKLVDLDVAQQGVSQIWGMEIGIGDPNGDWITGTFETIFFRQLLNPRNVTPDGVTQPYSAGYQSVLTNVKWPDSLRSPFLRELQEASPKLLSICFVVDSFTIASAIDGVPNPRFTLGRVAGTIGPATSTEPLFYPAPGRLLRPVVSTGARESASAARPLADRAATMKEGDTGVRTASREAIANPTFNYAWAAVDPRRSVAVFDLGNSLQFDGAGPADVGKLQAAIVTSSGPVILGPIDNTLANYEERAWIFEVPLTSSQLEDTASSPLTILADGKTVLSENKSGAFVEANDHVLRMDANTTARITFRATTFGAPPAAGQEIVVGPPQPDDGVLVITPSTVPINADGTATVTIKSRDPGSARPNIDGQVYALPFSWSKDENPDRNAFVAVKVYSRFNAPSSPQWSDVKPIFDQFMHLYPSMQSIMNLSDEQTVRDNAVRIRQYLAFPPENPRFMPVTRDLSGPKTKMLLAFLDSI